VQPNASDDNSAADPMGNDYMEGSNDFDESNAVTETDESAVGITSNASSDSNTTVKAGAVRSVGSALATGILLAATRALALWQI